MSPSTLHLCRCKSIQGKKQSFAIVSVVDVVRVREETILSGGIVLSKGGLPFISADIKMKPLALMCAGV